MLYTINKIISTSPESRQSKNMFRGGRDAEIVARTNYGRVNNILSFSSIVVPPTGSSARFYAASTLLLDGRVFCTNGIGGTRNDIYDPINDTVITSIDTTGSKDYSWTGGVLLKDGRIFIPPYRTSDNSPARSRIYDPTSNTISVLPRLYPNGRYGGGVVLFDGRIFLPPYGTGTTALVLDINTNMVTIPPMIYSSGIYGCCLLLDGKVVTPEYGTRNIYIWNPLDNTFKIGLSPPGNIYIAAACLLGDGKVFIIDYTSYPQTNVIYDPITNSSFNTLGVSGISFVDYCCLMPNGKIFVNGYTNACFYNPSTNSHDEVTPLFDSGNYTYATQTVLLDGRIFLAPTFSTAGASKPFCFVGNKLPQLLPLARVAAPVFNRT